LAPSVVEELPARANAESPSKEIRGALPSGFSERVLRRIALCVLAAAPPGFRVGVGRTKGIRTRDITP